MYRIFSLTKKQKKITELRSIIKGSETHKTIITNTFQFLIPKNKHRGPQLRLFAGFIFFFMKNVFPIPLLSLFVIS